MNAPVVLLAWREKFRPVGILLDQNTTDLPGRSACAPMHIEPWVS